jgi:tRNA A37 N6-isopentenylltransferase MiaA
MEHESEDERWIWLNFAPEHRLILAAYAGAMTQDAAHEVVKQTCDRINEEELPLFVTDGRKYYAQALLDRYSYTKEFPRNRKTRTSTKTETNAIARVKICPSNEGTRRRKRG